MRIDGAHAEYQRRTARFHLVEGELKTGNSQNSISYGTILITDMLKVKKPKAGKADKAGETDQADQVGDAEAGKPKRKRQKKSKTIEDINAQILKVEANIKKNKKHPKQNSRAFPLLLRVKIKEFRPASSQKQIGERFPPSGVLKSTIPIGKRPEKRPKKN